jgi:hypothetical protein
LLLNDSFAGDRDVAPKQKDEEKGVTRIGPGESLSFFNGSSKAYEIIIK